MSNIVPLKEVQTMAQAVTKSGMFNLKNENQALTLMLIAQAENIHPVQAVQMYSIINGMPSLKSTEVQARFQRSGGKIEWIETTDKKAVCKLSHPDGGTYTSEYTIEQAKQMGLTSKDNWVKMPKAMLMARCISSGVRAIYPACLNNLYSVEEAMDIPAPDAMPTIEKEATDAEIVEEEMTVPTMKLMLSNRLKELSFSTADIKDFAEKFNLAEDTELLESLVNDKKLLVEKVAEFEK